MEHNGKRVRKRNFTEKGRWILRKIHGSFWTADSFKLSELRSLMNTAVYENEKRLNVYNENITLNDWYETWLDVYKKNTVRATTYANYTSNYERYICPEIGFMKLSDINKTAEHFARTWVYV